MLWKSLSVFCEPISARRFVKLKENSRFVNWWELFYKLVELSLKLNLKTHKPLHFNWGAEFYESFLYATLPLRCLNYLCLRIYLKGRQEVSIGVLKLSWKRSPKQSWIKEQLHERKKQRIARCTEWADEWSKEKYFWVPRLMKTLINIAKWTSTKMRVKSGKMNVWML